MTTQEPHERTRAYWWRLSHVAEHPTVEELLEGYRFEQRERARALAARAPRRKPREYRRYARGCEPIAWEELDLEPLFPPGPRSSWLQTN